MQYPRPFLKFISVLKRLPGVGNKSAERYAFDMLEWSPQELEEMAQVLTSIQKEMQPCPECQCYKVEDRCSFCHDPRRDREKLCVIASARDVYALEQTHEYQGLYHALNALLSPMEGIGPEQLRLPYLIERIKSLGIKEVVIALDATLEGDATALYLKKELEGEGITLSRLAFGLPMGSSLEYVDEGTLARAFTGRGAF